MANLFVAGEAEANPPVRDFRVPHQEGGRFHDDGQARLVIGAEQRRAVSGYQRAALQLFQLGIVDDSNHLGRVARQHNVAALVVAVHDGLDVVPAGFRRCVKMSDQGDHRCGRSASGGKRGRDNAKLILAGVADAHRL